MDRIFKLLLSSVMAFLCAFASHAFAQDPGEAEDEFWILPNFVKGNNATLTDEQRTIFNDMSVSILRHLEEDEIKAKRCVRIIGHASTWTGITDEVYCQRSISRAKEAAGHLKDFLEHPEGYFSPKSCLLYTSDAADE